MSVNFRSHRYFVASTVHRINNQNIVIICGVHCIDVFHFKTYFLNVPFCLAEETYGIFQPTFLPHMVVLPTMNTVRFGSYLHCFPFRQAVVLSLCVYS